MFTRKKDEPTTTPATPTPRKPSEDSHAPPPAFRSVADEGKSSGLRTPETSPRASVLEPVSRAQRPSRAAGNSSVLNSHLFFQGDLRYAGTVTLDCEIHGSITTDDMLVVGSSARVEGEVHAGVVEISGKVHGNVFAKTRVKIFTGGEVCGDIETPTVSMDEGVVFEGCCRRPAVTASSSPVSNDVHKVLAGAETVLGPAPSATGPAPVAGSSPSPASSGPSTTEPRSSTGVRDTVFST